MYCIDYRDIQNNVQIFLLYLEKKRKYLTESKKNKKNVYRIAFLGIYRVVQKK